MARFRTSAINFDARLRLARQSWHCKVRIASFAAQAASKALKYNDYSKRHANFARIAKFKLLSIPGIRPQNPANQKPH
jgi:hypothetical protein